MEPPPSVGDKIIYINSIKMWNKDWYQTRTNRLLDLSPRQLSSFSTFAPPRGCPVVFFPLPFIPRKNIKRWHKISESYRHPWWWYSLPYFCCSQPLPTARPFTMQPIMSPPSLAPGALAARMLLLDPWVVHFDYSLLFRLKLLWCQGLCYAISRVVYIPKHNRDVIFFVSIDHVPSLNVWLGSNHSTDDGYYEIARYRMTSNGLLFVLYHVSSR